MNRLNRPPVEPRPHCSERVRVDTLGGSDRAPPCGDRRHRLMRGRAADLRGRRPGVRRRVRRAARARPGGVRQRVRALVGGRPDQPRTRQPRPARARARARGARPRALRARQPRALAARCWLGLREVSEFDSFQDVLDAPDADEWIEWIRTRPLACTGQLGRQSFAMVHASVAPSWSLARPRVRGARGGGAPARADRRACARSSPSSPDPRRRPARAPHARRSVGATATLVGGRASRQGARRGTRRGSSTSTTTAIVYGHWAMQGLHVATGLRGLDTGCVHHGRGRDGSDRLVPGSVAQAPVRPARRTLLVDPRAPRLLRAPRRAR